MARAILVGTAAIRPDAAAGHARGTAPRGATDADGRAGMPGGTAVVRRKGELSKYAIYTGWPHQVALPTPSRNAACAANIARSRSG